MRANPPITTTKRNKLLITNQRGFHNSDVSSLRLTRKFTVSNEWQNLDYAQVKSRKRQIYNAFYTSRNRKPSCRVVVVVVVKLCQWTEGSYDHSYYNSRLQIAPL